MVFGGAIPVSEGARVLITSMWTSIVLVSIAGLKWEKTFVALLVFQIVYKVVFLTAYALPRLISGRGEQIPKFLCVIFLLGAVTFPFFIWTEFN